MKDYHGWKHPEDDSPNVMCLYGGGRPLPKPREMKFVTEGYPNFTTEFDWGFLGAGSVQLSYALLHDYIGPKKARLYYRDFAGQVTSSLPSTWTLTGDQIDAFLRRMEPPCALERIAGPDILP